MKKLNAIQHLFQTEFYKDLHLLAILYEYPGAIDMLDLYPWLMKHDYHTIETSEIEYHLNIMEKRGWVTTKKNDKEAILAVSITIEGLTMAKKVETALGLFTELGNYEREETK